MSFFRKLLGLGPKEPINTRRKEIKTEIENTDVITYRSTSISMEGRKIYPVLMSQKTREFDLVNELVVTFHVRENIFSNIVMGHVMVDENDMTDGEPAIYQVRTTDKTEEDYYMIQDTGKLNFEDFKMPFIDWNLKDGKLNFRILSCKVSLLSSEKILSKKHMQEAHDMLNAKEIMVSIPRRGLIFVCSKDIPGEDYDYFLNLHASIVLQENKDQELLCEDVFIVENGEISGVLNINALSDALRKGA